MPPPWASLKNPWEKDLDETKYDTKTALGLVQKSAVQGKNDSISLRSGGRILTLGTTATAETENSQMVYPMGDFRVSERASNRRLETMMGITPKAERRELLVMEQKPSERPSTDSEKWEGRRKRSQQISEEATRIAMKRDDGAWADVDGYQQTREPPAFRDGFNTTLRVKPPPEAHLFNGLQQMTQRATGMEATASGPLLHSWTQATTTNHAQRQLIKHSGRGHQGSALAPARSTQQQYRKPVHDELTLNMPGRVSDAGESGSSRNQIARPSSGADLQVSWPLKAMPGQSSAARSASQIHREKLESELMPNLQGLEDSGTVSHARVNDLVHRLSLRPDVSKALGAYFLWGLTSELGGLKTGKQFALASEFRKEHGTEELKGSGLNSEISGRGSLDTKVDGIRMQGEIELLLKTLSCEEAPQGFLSSSASIEEARRKEQELSRSLGNAFVALGMTLPAGPKDDPLRNDSVALAMGARMMGPEAHRSAKGPLVPEGIRKEVAIALGRALLHLRMASVGIEAGRGKSKQDKQMRDRDLRSSIGRLTLQLLEATAARSGKSLTTDPKRREILASALGAAVLHLEASSGRSHATDRNKTEAPLLQSKALPMGPEASSKQAALVRMNKPIDIVVRRPMLPGRESAPSTVPRHIPKSA